MGLDIAFWVLAVVSVGAALAVVLMRDIFRAALFLVLCFFTVAGIYITLSADFLAGAQVLIYVGAIGVLIIFAIMLTRESRRGSPSGRLRLPALLIGLLFLVTMVFVVVSTDWHVIAELPTEPTTTAIAQALFSGEDGFVLAFEIAAALLLAAIIGAIVLVREK
ncbi:MAG: NADH-quinone oxidoreductase subunit J [Dehalococcoidia bacterium]|nr:NADH-quinone oxidoreductase subunit J [Dehalococcoidia bacterium]MCK5653661.1 NADH-quinone oxidoreductase subunit J [Dehalococcoidia bacterium]